MTGVVAPHEPQDPQGPREARPEQDPGRQEPRRRLRRFLADRLAVAGAVFLCLVGIAAAFAPWLAPHDPAATDLANRFAPPFSSGHLLGTDDIGRDLLSRIIHGARISLLAGAGSVGAALAVALPVGLVAGYAGGRVEWLVMRVVDFLLAIPPLVLVFAVAGILGPSLRNVVVALGVYFAPLFLRLVVTETRRLRDSLMVDAARVVGTPAGFILRRHLLPNIAPAVIVQAALSVGVAIIAEASLSFLGLGVRPPEPSWGVMLRSAFELIDREPWLVFVPAAAMALTVLAFNLVGDGLAAALGKRRARP